MSVHIRTHTRVQEDKHLFGILPTYNKKSKTNQKRKYEQIYWTIADVTDSNFTQTYQSVLRIGIVDKAK